MKRHCKNIDITDLDFIKQAINDCMKNKTNKRHDIQVFWRKYKTIDAAAQQIQDEIINRDLRIPVIYYRDKVDAASGKLRVIGIQNIKQQIYDYICVNAMKDLMKQVGEYQCASIKGRGQVYGMKRIRQWVTKDQVGTKYVLKCDIRKFYPSVDQDKLMRFLRKKIKNETLLWLINELLKTFDDGLSIGSYLSQNLANLYLSQLYHFISEQCFIKKVRRGVERKYSLSSHVLFYMDDILVLGSNKTNLKKLLVCIQDKLKEMGLELKADYQLYKLDENHFIDMMGFKIYRHHVTIRKRNWKRIRRSYIRFERKQQNLNLARRIASYWGFVFYTNSRKIRNKYHMDHLKFEACNLISMKGSA